MEFAVEMDPNYDDGWLVLADIYRQLRMNEEALEAYIRADELQPGYARDPGADPGAERRARAYRRPRRWSDRSELEDGGRNMSQQHVPATTVQRLPVYLRCLLRAQQQRVSIMNSVGIAEMAGTNAAQVRKDLSYLGEYGTRGIGYDVDELATHLMRWLGVSEERRAAIVGFGRLGSALTGYEGFADKGVRIVAVLDADSAKVGTDVDGMEVEPISTLGEVFAREDVEIAIITVPATVAQAVADVVVAAGTRAILNFAPVRLDVPEDVQVRQADVAAELQILSFHLNAEHARRTRDKG